MIIVEVPATSANCCVGFDCMGMAIEWRAKFSFSKAETLQIEGCPTEYQGEDNLVVQAFDQVCQKLGQERPAFHLTIDSTIPFARGLGSSATCIVGGILAANAWFDSPLSKEDCLYIACEMEGHPDNVAPALFGGICISQQIDHQVICKKLKSVDWHALLMIPSYPIMTSEARKVLPAALSFQQAKEQVAYALLIEDALMSGDEEILKLCSRDQLHEPYRKKLIADHDSIEHILNRYDLPLWISGSGSTMISLSKNRERLEEADRALDLIETRLSSVADGGARVYYE